MINEKIESNGGFIFKKIVEKFSEDRIRKQICKSWKDSKEKLAFKKEKQDKEKLLKISRREKE